MKLNEVIELNGKEYTVELNRESIVKIEQYVKIQDTVEKITEPIFEDKSEMEIADDENPFAESINEDEVEKINEEREQALKKMYTRAFWIWLYPVENLSYNSVKELIEPYMQDEKKAKYLAKKYEDFTVKSADIRKKYIEERKNLKALAN